MTRILPAVGWVLLAMLLLSSCATLNYPAITSEPTNEYRYGDVVWRDLVTNMPSEAAGFYNNVFGWEIAKVVDKDPSYYTIKNRGKLIGGMIYSSKRPDDAGSEWVSLVSVESVGTSAAAIKEAGGTVYGEDYTIEGRGQVALISDPSEAFLGIIHASGGDPIVGELNDGDWLWTELWTTDPESAGAFYESFGVSITREEKGGNDYYLFKSGDEVVASMLQTPVENWRSMWVPYVKVSDAAAMAERSERFGGKVVMAPNDQVRDGSVAVIMDPSGAMLVLQEWEK